MKEKSKGTQKQLSYPVPYCESNDYKTRVDAPTHIGFYR